MAEGKRTTGSGKGGAGKSSQKRGRGKGSAADLAARMSRISSHTAERPSMPMRRPESPAATAGDKYSERINLYITPQMAEALKIAQVHDRITISARIRGMIDLWMEGQPDPQADPPRTEPSRIVKAMDIRARKHKG